MSIRSRLAALQKRMDSERDRMCSCEDYVVTYAETIPGLPTYGHPRKSDEGYPIGSVFPETPPCKVCGGWKLVINVRYKQTPLPGFSQRGAPESTNSAHGLAADNGKNAGVVLSDTSPVPSPAATSRNAGKRAPQRSRTLPDRYGNRASSSS